MFEAPSLCATSRPMNENGPLTSAKSLHPFPLKHPSCVGHHSTFSDGICARNHMDTQNQTANTATTPFSSFIVGNDERKASDLIKPSGLSGLHLSDRRNQSLPPSSSFLTKHASSLPPPIAAAGPSLPRQNTVCVVGRWLASDGSLARLAR